MRFDGLEIRLDHLKVFFDLRQLRAERSQLAFYVLNPRFEATNPVLEPLEAAIYCVEAAIYKPEPFVHAREPELRRTMEHPDGLHDLVETAVHLTHARIYHGDRHIRQEAGRLIVDDTATLALAT
jgi:hypothetical protein